MSAGTDFSIKPFTEVIEKELCLGGHRVDGKTPKLHDIEFDGRTCDCGRIKYIAEGCGCGNKNKELHGHPNQ